MQSRYSRIAFALVGVTMLSTPASAKIYNVQFAGKVVQVDCPEDPAGHTLTWVNQNCTGVRTSQNEPAQMRKADTKRQSQ
ncbi:hypothetical protein [Pseudohoeflea coraliihabitans]|uniref:Uncharacterized protein n=1 Tax=Pseudohoeflea coraliihabitans TaxID=2860393 RepID=A0ABS6WTF5_9HYPH|nr:hypothetical protein [Pseudohoeflea sp. DP4N28-3]MBW3098339.1 hypothetical protein [Pseudohoeflea sp. DP4N28-3]